MYYTWPQTDYTLNDVILNHVKLSETDQTNFIKAIGINYALDTIFIFSWIVSWIGLFLHFKSLNVKLITLCFGLSFLGALLDITENTISFGLLIGNHKNAESILFIHTIIRDISFWLPMLGSFILTIIIPQQKSIETLVIKTVGSIGVVFAILGMYIQYFSAIPYYWFGAWFLASALFLFRHYKKGMS